MLWLLSLGGWLKSGLRAAWSVFQRYPWQVACIALCSLSWALWARGDRYRNDLLATLEAQQKAAADQVAVNHEPARKSQAIAEKSHVDEKAYYEKGRRAGLAYADAHRVPASCALRSASVPGTDRPAPVDDGPGEDPDMVAVSREDFETLTGNSLRLAKVQQDALDLIDAGVAVALPDPEFGKP